jgi:uncharacterized membrane protein
MKASVRIVLMATLFVVSMFTLIGKLITPTPFQIFIEGEEPIPVGQILSFTHIDVAIIVISTFLAGISGFYLLFSDFIEVPKVVQTVEMADTSELDGKFALRLLDGDEKRVFGEILESGGEILQRDLPIQLNFPKVKITRILDQLEKKGLIIRKRFGMTNKVIVNRNMRMESASR